MTGEEVRGRSSRSGREAAAGCSGCGHTPLTIRFAGDVMLGKLTDYLLHAGYDCTYEHGIEDDRLIRLAEREGRVLLTCDRPLVRRLPERVRGVLVESGELSEQLRQVVRRFGLRFDPAWIFTRCSGCNRALESQDPNRVADRLPGATRTWVEEVYRCPECETVYWRGTHCEALRGTLAEWGLMPREHAGG